jgi:hypothetical protein
MVAHACLLIASLGVSSDTASTITFSGSGASKSWPFNLLPYTEFGTASSFDSLTAPVYWPEVDGSRVIHNQIPCDPTTWSGDMSDKIVFIDSFFVYMCVWKPDTASNYFVIQQAGAVAIMVWFHFKRGAEIQTTMWYGMYQDDYSSRITIPVGMINGYAVGDLRYCHDTPLPRSDVLPYITNPNFTSVTATIAPGVNCVALEADSTGVRIFAALASLLYIPLFLFVLFCLYKLMRKSSMKKVMLQIDLYLLLIAPVLFYYHAWLTWSSPLRARGPFNDFVNVPIFHVMKTIPAALATVVLVRWLPLMIGKQFSSKCLAAWYVMASLVVAGFVTVFLIGPMYNISILKNSNVVATDVNLQEAMQTPSTILSFAIGILYVVLSILLAVRLAMIGKQSNSASIMKAVKNLMGFSFGTGVGLTVAQAL